MDKALVREFIEILNHDVITARDDVAADPMSFTRRRAFVRATFAAMEGQTYIFKQAALHDHEVKQQPLTSAERYLLEEDNYQLQNGEAVVDGRPMQLKLPENFRFAIKMYVRSWGGGEPDFTVGETGDPWKRLRETVRIRNRLVHPKSVGDLDVSIADTDLVGATWNWFLRVATKNQPP